MPYYSVIMKYRQEVCVKAKDEGEAEEVARNADFSINSDALDETEAEELYNEREDAGSIEEFKSEDKYAEAEQD